MNRGDFLYYTMTENFIAHHGVKGQRWGVRRYQNPDGTLTDKGRKKYSKQLDKSIKKKMTQDQLNEKFTKETKSWLSDKDKEKIKKYDKENQEHYKKINKIEKENSAYEKSIADAIIKRGGYITEEEANRLYIGDKKLNDAYDKIIKNDAETFSLIDKVIDKNLNIKNMKRLQKKNWRCWIVYRINNICECFKIRRKLKCHR